MLAEYQVPIIAFVWRPEEMTPIGDPHGSSNGEQGYLRFFDDGDASTAFCLTNRPALPVALRISRFPPPP